MREFAVRAAARSVLSFLGALAALAFLLASPRLAEAEEASATAASQVSRPGDAAFERPRIGLVLSGGGARGAAHVGVLKVLEELRVPVDCIVGTSMGSIVGGLYAAGVSPSEIEATLTEADWGDLFDDSPDRRDLPFRRKQEDRELLFKLEFGVSRSGLTLPGGLLAGRKLGYLLQKMTTGAVGVERFDDLSIPFRAVAADVNSGEMVVLEDGDLGRAMRASMAIPGAFTPVERDGRTLVDGGIVRNLPVDVALEMGADIVIAVDITPPVRRAEGPESALDTFMKSVAVVTLNNVRPQIADMGPDDVLISPDLGELAPVDFAKSAEAIALGEEAARDAAPLLTRFSVGEDEYDDYIGRHRFWTDVPAALVVDRIEIAGSERVSDAIVADRMHLEEGRPLDMDTLLEDMERVYALGDFENVEFGIERQSGETVLVITTRDKSWGPNYFRLGMEVEADFRGRSEFAMRAYYRRARVNRRGAEWRTRLQFGAANEICSEFHQPLDYSGVLFVSPHADFGRGSSRVFVDETSVAEYRVKSWQAGVDGGAELGDFGELRVGLYRGGTQSELAVGAPDLPPLDGETGGYIVRATYDRLDNPYFPRRGTFLLLGGEFSRTRFGADASYHKLHMTCRSAVSFGRNTALLAAVGGTGLETDLGSSEFELGGLFRLSGVEQGRVRGSHMAVVSLAVLRRVFDMPPGTGSGAYLGFSVEAGNAWRDRAAVGVGDLIYSSAVFIAVDSVLGPLYLGAGAAEGGSYSLYLVAGSPF